MYQIQRGVYSSIFLLLLFFQPVYAQTSDFAEPISGIFDWIDDLFTQSIQESEFDNSTETNLIDTLNSGTESGKKGVSLWFSVHEFFVNLIFTGVSETDLPIDKDIIVIISMIMVSLLLIGLVLKLIRENTKIAIIVILILVSLGVVGLGIEF